ncbi:MAG: hypothetical protein R6U98_04985 [Pirellulaceae bacterium]
MHHMIGRSWNLSGFRLGSAISSAVMARLFWGRERDGSRHSDFRCESAGFVKDSGTGKTSEKASGRKNHGNREVIESPEREEAREK